MSKFFKLVPDNAGLLVVDVQEKLFPYVDRPCEVMEKIQQLVKGVKLLDLPIIATEQYPKGLGETIKPLKDLIGEKALFPEKTAFSVCGDERALKTVEKAGKKQWIVCGIEAHVCVLQTVRDLLEKGYEVVVVNDAISSRSIFDFSTAIAELRDMGARISSVETVLFELFGDAKHPKFKELSALVK